jgi:hypothetical protein
MALFHDTVKNLIGKAIPNLRQLQAEEDQRKELERVEQRAAAHRDLQEAKAKLDTELPGLEASCALARQRVESAKAELREADKALSASSDLRLSRSSELRNAIASCEQRLKTSAPAAIIEFIKFCDAEFEKVRRENITAISSGRDGSSGEPTIWIRSNSKSLIAKRDVILDSRRRAQEMLLELEDPGPELAKLKAALEEVGGITVEEIKGRFAVPVAPPYDRYSDQPAPKADPRKVEHW